jgi:serine protease AprX
MTQRTNFPITRRTALKALGGASLLPFAGTGAAGTASTATIDDSFDLSASGVQEALVVFADDADPARLGALDLERGFHAFEVLPVGYAELTVDQIETVADWDSVRYVEQNRELELHNDDAREVTGAGTVQSDLGYDGESVHAVVVDTGIDGDHPDLEANLVANYQWAGDPLETSGTLWFEMGAVDSDELGHGTHCAGSVGGDGSASDGEFTGMAPKTDLTAYSTSAGAYLIKAVAAYDHMLANGDGETYQVVSNSYGTTSGDDFNPDGALEVATWYAFEQAILPVFSASNSGEDDLGNPQTNMLNDYAKAPHVLGVAATRDDRTVTDFSSRGRTPSYGGGGDGAHYDRAAALDNLRDYYAHENFEGPHGIYRVGVGAPGNYVVSTLSEEDPLQGYAAGTEHQDTRVYYGALSGTSMSCPVTSGVASLVIDAYRQTYGEYPDPIDVLNTLEATAYEAHDEYTPWDMGAGFVDAETAVRRAESGDLAGFDDVELTDY